MKISVVVPAFHSVHLGTALDSVLAQTLPPAQIIVVDGSPDTTRAALEPFLDRVTRVIQPPRGVSAARNLGIECAQGDYVAFLDADDLWLQDKLERQVRALAARPEAAFTFCTVWNYSDDPSVPTDPYDPAPLRDWLHRHGAGDLAVGGRVHDLLLACNCVATSSVLVRTTALLAVGLFDESLRNGEDYDLWLRLAQRYPAVFVRPPLARYRVHPAGLSGEWAARADLFYRSNIHVLKKHLDRAAERRTRQALAHTCAEYSVFLLKSGRGAEARKAAADSLALWPTLRATRSYAEARWPSAYRAVAGLRPGGRAPATRIAP